MTPVKLLNRASAASISSDLVVGLAIGTTCLSDRPGTAGRYRSIVGQEGEGMQSPS